jgi:hypothetical protein
MVFYSVDTEPRRKIIAIMALMSLLITYLPTFFFPTFSSKLGPLSVLGVFAAFFYIFDQFFWKYIPGVGIPNLSGTWTGKLIRGTEPGKIEGKESDISIKLSQTWYRMDIVFKGTHSVSRSEIIGLFVNNPNHIELCYAYYKRPKDASGSGHEYSNGYTRLVLEIADQNWLLVGRYFSDEFRGGTIRLSREG